MGVEQLEVLKERLPDVLLVCSHCEEATHCGAALETRRGPDGETDNPIYNLQNWTWKLKFKFIRLI